MNALTYFHVLLSLTRRGFATDQSQRSSELSADQCLNYEYSEQLVDMLILYTIVCMCV